MAQIAQLLNDTLSNDANLVRTATDSLDRLSLLPHFLFSLLSISTGNFLFLFFISQFNSLYCLPFFFFKVKNSTELGLLDFLICANSNIHCVYISDLPWCKLNFTIQEVKIRVKELLLLHTLRISLGEISIVIIQFQMSVRSLRTTLRVLCFRLNLQF